MPWAEGGNGETVSKCTVTKDSDEEKEPWEWYVVLAGSGTDGMETWKKGK